MHIYAWANVTVKLLLLSLFGIDIITFLLKCDYLAAELDK